MIVLLWFRGAATLTWTLLAVRVAETPLVTREVVQVTCVGPTRGQTRAHVGGTVRGVAETIELTPVGHPRVLGPGPRGHAHLGPDHQGARPRLAVVVLDVDGAGVVRQRQLAGGLDYPDVRAVAEGFLRTTSQSLN